MEEQFISARLLLNDRIIARAPNVLRALDTGEMSWDAFLRVLCDDITTGRDTPDWVTHLAQEGDLDLALRVAKIGGVNESTSLYQELQSLQQEWKMRIEMQRGFVLEQVEEYKDILNVRIHGDIVELLERCESLIAQQRYSQSLAALEEIQAILSSTAKEWQRQQQEARDGAELRLIEIKELCRHTNPFPGGQKRKQQMMSLLSRASTLDCPPLEVLQICDIIQALCEDRPFDEVQFELLLKKETPLRREVRVTDIPSTREKTEAEEEIFEFEWSSEADEFLIERYDQLTSIQLCRHLSVSGEEIEKRLRYLGLDPKQSRENRPRWTNPYVVGRPLKTKRVFYGREEVFKFIENTLGHTNIEDDRNLIVLEGHRRTGKTSILLQLCKNRRIVLAPRIPVFVTLEGMLPFRGGTKNFFYKLAFKIHEYLTENENIILPQPEEDEFIDPPMQFQKFMRQAERAAGDVGFVIMLDEFQIIDPKRSLLDIDVYKMLRSVMQHDTRLDFILSGTLEMEKLFREYRAALFGSALRKRITFLDPKDAEALILKPVEQHLSYDREAVQTILDITASHPYFVQLICWALVDYLKERGKSKVQVTDIRHIVPQSLDRGIHFAEIWSSETDEESSSLEIANIEQYITSLMGEMISEMFGWCSIHSIQEALRQKNRFPKNSDSFDEAIENLLKRQVVAYSEDGKSVRFQVELFRLWVKSKKPFTSVERDIQAKAAKFRRQKENEPFIPSHRS